jgi:tungstate transport system ATP-binding protein
MASLLPLELRDVSFAARGRTILDRVSLRLGPGTRTVVLGPNGAGKSVLLRVMHGLIAPTSGSVRWSGAAMPGGRPIMAFTVTITAPRPGKRVRAIRAPSGMPSRAAQATALRLTASDSRTMASSAGSPVSSSWSADVFSAMDLG